MRRAVLAFMVGVLLCVGCGDETHPFGPYDPTCRTIDSDPDWSPDGNTIAYAHGYQIWLLDLHTTEKGFLTNGLGWPAWSPDGEKIAFVRNHDIHVIDVETEEVSRLTFWGSCYFPSWSPDGTRIVYETAFGDSAGIWMMNADGSRREQITWFYGGFPDWSPDGLRLAVVSWLADNGSYYEEIVLLGLADSSVVRLTDNRRSDRYPCWSPDGSMIAWASFGEGDDPLGGIWVMNADGSNQHHLQWGGHPSWSPDASRIVYKGYNQDSDTMTLWVMNADGTDPHPLTTPDDYE